MAIRYFSFKKESKVPFFPFLSTRDLKKNNFFHLSTIAGIEPCAVGSTVEVLINPHHAAKPELLEVSLILVMGTGKCPLFSHALKNPPK